MEMIPILPGNQLRASTAVSPGQSEQGRPQAPCPTLPHLWGRPRGALGAQGAPAPLRVSQSPPRCLSWGLSLSLLLFVSVRLSLSVQPPVPSTQGASELQPQGWARVPAQPCPQGGLRSRQRPHLCLRVPQAGRPSPGLAPGSTVRVSGWGWVGGALPGHSLSVSTRDVGTPGGVPSQRLRPLRDLVSLSVAPCDSDNCLSLSAAHPASPRTPRPRSVPGPALGAEDPRLPLIPREEGAQEAGRLLPSPSPAGAPPYPAGTRHPHPNSPKA